MPTKSKHGEIDNSNIIASPEGIKRVTRKSLQNPQVVIQNVSSSAKKRKQVSNDKTGAKKGRGRPKKASTSEEPKAEEEAAPVDVPDAAPIEAADEPKTEAEATVTDTPTSDAAAPAEESKGEEEEENGKEEEVKEEEAKTEEAAPATEEKAGEAEAAPEESKEEA